MPVVSEDQNDTRNGAQGSRRSRWARAAFAALSGVIAGFCALAVAELVAAVVRPEAGPVAAVGGAVIDRTPPALKDFAVRNFGTNDKLVLQLGILALLAVFAMAVGVLAVHRRLIGSAAVLVFGVVGAVAAIGRPEGRVSDALPSVVGAVVAAGVLYLLAGRLAPVPGPSPAAGGRDTEPDHGTFDRRRFVIAASAAAAASAGAGLLGRRLTSAVQAGAAASRRDLVLPVPVSAAPAVPAGADLGIRGLSSFVTPNKSFYRVDTALVVPRVDADEWRLRIHGKGVKRPLTLSFQDLLRREIIERDITLTCVSNEVGGPYVGNARWIGVRLADLLREAGVEAPVPGRNRRPDRGAFGGRHDDRHSGRGRHGRPRRDARPRHERRAAALRARLPGPDGRPRPVRIRVGLQVAEGHRAHHVRRLRRLLGQAVLVPAGAHQDRVPHRHPRPFASPKAGTIPVAGVAWAQHRGIQRVEVRVDGGPWNTARLAAEDSRDTWRQWVWQWPATSGSHTLEVRATDRAGATQTEERVGTVPNGATGWHSVVVDVS